jgi:hypothetical protein
MYEAVTSKFEAIGARAKLSKSRRRFRGETVFLLDVKEDKKGEYFDIAVGDNPVDFKVLQAVPKERHLLLMSEDGQRFLCGHDERHWFIAPVKGSVSTVLDARKSLLPSELSSELKQLPAGKLLKRKNSSYIRQGEWFFVPVHRDMLEETKVIHKNEPLQRSPRSKPHICEEMIRTGGRTVYVVRNRVYSQKEFTKLKQENDKFAPNFRTTIADPIVYVRGSVRHPDHKTINLSGWHRAFLNDEDSAKSQSTVAFLD